MAYPSFSNASPAQALSDLKVQLNTALNALAAKSNANIAKYKTAIEAAYNDLVTSFPVFNNGHYYDLYWQFPHLRFYEDFPFANVGLTGGLAAKIKVMLSQMPPASGGGGDTATISTPPASSRLIADVNAIAAAFHGGDPMLPSKISQAVHDAAGNSQALGYLIALQKLAANAVSMSTQLGLNAFAAQLKALMALLGMTPTILATRQQATSTTSLLQTAAKQLFPGNYNAGATSSVVSTGNLNAPSGGNVVMPPSPQDNVGATNGGGGLLPPTQPSQMTDSQKLGIAIGITAAIGLLGYWAIEASKHAVRR